MMREDWIEVELKDVCFNITDGSHFSPESSIEGRPYITVKDINFDRIDFFNCKKISESSYEELVKNGCKPEINDLLFSKDGTVGKVSLVDGIQDFVVLSSLAILKTNTNIIAPKFLFYILKSELFLSQALKKKKGVAIRRIILRDLKELKLNLAPLPEQRAIASKIEQLFSELDNGIANLKTAKSKLEIYRQAILKQAFEGKLKNPKNQTQKDDLPSEWTLKKINSLCEVVRGGSPRPAGDPRYYEGNIPFLKVADITRNEGIYLNTYTFTIKEAGLKNTRYVEANTLLLSNSGATLGVPKICTFPTTFNDGIAAFLGLDKDDLVYHYYFWMSKTRELRSINQGAAQPNLNTGMIGAFEIPIFSKEEQHQIVQEIETRLSVCDKLNESIDQSLEKAQALRQSILKKAFEGKLLSQDELQTCRQQTDWEPAAKLLEKVKKDSKTKR
jgi:type I restriction enzyme S subunit